MRRVLVGVVALTLCACPPGGGGGTGSDAASDAPADVELEAGQDGTADGVGGEGAAGEAGADASDGGATDATVDGTVGDGAPDVLVEAEAGPTCGFDAGSAPDGSPVCGDGFRDPMTEECDDGLGNADPTRRACSSQCQVLDELAVWEIKDGGLSNSPRTLGAGRHPISASDSTFGVVYLEPNSNPLMLSLATFTARGAATGTINPFSAQTTVVDNSNPVVAGLPCGKYAVAWAEFDSEGGDELDVAVSIVDPNSPPAGAPATANQMLAFSQYDPDIIWTGSQLVVAWVDTSDQTSEPDLRYRTFDNNFSPTSGEQTLAGTLDSEADVALAPFAGSWAAAWRDDSTAVDASGLETVQVLAGTTSWSVGPFLPAPVGAKPALTALDMTHLLLIYTLGIDDNDSGVANGSRIYAAVLDTASPGAVTGVPVPAMVASATGLDQSTPAAATVQGNVFISWWTAGALGDPNGEELWLKSVGWSGSSLDSGSNLDLSASEVPLPRWQQARLGDQELPTLAATTLPPGGALLTGWNDLGRTIATGEGNSDVAVELIPVPPLRTGDDGGP